MMMYVMVCAENGGKATMAMWAFLFVQSDRGTKSVAPSQPLIRNLNMKSGIVHLGHLDFEEAGLYSQWTRETDQEADLPQGLQSDH